MIKVLGDPAEGDVLSTEQFCYWLQGFCELTDNAPTELQWRTIKQHLELCFKPIANPVHESRPLDANQKRIVQSILDQAKKKDDKPARQPIAKWQEPIRLC
jgi:hypothetical protein